MLERLKGLWTTHKKLCVLGIAVIASGAVYVLGGFEVSPEIIVEKVCGFIGC